MDAAKVQPDPKTGNQIIWDLVKNDMAARVAFGEAKYGQKLKSHDGRDNLLDIYQEILDAAFYIRKAIYERDNPEPPLSSFNPEDPPTLYYV